MKRMPFQQVLLSLLFTLIFINPNAVSPKIPYEKSPRTEITYVPLKPYITLYKIYWKSVLLQATCQMAKYICGLDEAPETSATTMSSTVPPTTSTTPTPPATLPPVPIFQTIYIVIEEKMNWMEAHINCKLEGYELTTVEDDSELFQLQSVISSSNLTFADFVWTAGNDLFRNGKYTWVSTGQTFTEFLPQGNIEPTQLPLEDCVFLYFTPTFGIFVMADYTCDFKAASVCKKVAPIPP